MGGDGRVRRRLLRALATPLADDLQVHQVRSRDGFIRAVFKLDSSSVVGCVRDGLIGRVFDGFVRCVQGQVNGVRLGRIH